MVALCDLGAGVGVETVIAEKLGTLLASVLGESSRAFTLLASYVRVTTLNLKYKVQYADVK